MKKILFAFLIFFFLTTLSYSEIPLNCSPKPCKMSQQTLTYATDDDESITVSGPAIIMAVVVKTSSGIGVGANGTLTVVNSDSNEIFDSYTATGSYIQGSTTYYITMNIPIVETNTITLTFGTNQTGTATISIYTKGGN